MTRRRIFPAMAILVCLLAACAPRARADQDFLNMIPSDAVAFVVVHDLEEVDGKVTKLTSQVGFLPRSPLAMLKLSVRSVAGLDENGSVALVFMPPETEGDQKLTEDEVAQWMRIFSDEENKTK